MSVDTHTIEAGIIGGSDLAVKSALITLDDGWSPYAQAELTLPVTVDVDDLLTELDCRTSPPPRVLVELDRSGLVPSSRDLNLTVRSRRIDHVRGEIVVKLASDEALLQDYALIAGALVNPGGTSVRVAVEYALNKIGASLNDEVITNLVRNPKVASATTDWSSLAGAGGTITSARITSGGPTAAVPAFYRVTATSTVPNPLYIWVASTAGGVPCSASTAYTASVWVRSNGATQVVLRTQDYNASNVSGTAYESSIVTLVANTWTRISVKFTTAATAASSRLHVESRSSMPNTRTLEVTGWRLSKSESDTVLDTTYFDGSTTDTTVYDYSWTGTTDASTSKRSRIMPDATAATTALDWPPGVSGWDYVNPMVQAANLRLWCDELRVWRLDPASTLQPGLLHISELTNATEAEDEITRDADWFDSVVIEYRSVAAGATVLEYDYAGAPGTKAKKFEYARAKPGSGAAAALLARAQGRGRVLKLEAVSDYDARPGEALLATLPDTPIQSGLVAAVKWRFPESEMAVESRGLVDTPLSAWMFLAPGVKWTDSAVGQSWLAETV